MGRDLGIRLVAVAGVALGVGLGLEGLAGFLGFESAIPIIAQTASNCGDICETDVLWLSRDPDEVAGIFARTYLENGGSFMEFGTKGCEWEPAVQARVCGDKVIFRVPIGKEGN